MLVWRCCLAPLRHALCVPVALHSPCLRCIWVQKAALAAVDTLLDGAPRRSVLLCDSSKAGEDGG